MLQSQFVKRHIGPRPHEVASMLETIGVSSVEELIDKTIPASIRMTANLDLPPAMSEREFFAHIKKLASKNKMFRSYIGMGYYNTSTPAVIQRNILENPSWYTSYTPYQAEISQGRLEALLNFQTMVTDLTGMELANASLLDEATAAAEAMIMMFNIRSRADQKAGKRTFFVDKDLFPQTIDVIRTRALPLNIELLVADFRTIDLPDSVFGAIVQYPNADGQIVDYANFVNQTHQLGAKVAVATDLLALTLLTPPGEWDADIVLGSTQRFGIPMGYGGPHAAFFATREQFKRNVPGRIIGVSKDTHGNPALRMALQTREQHIKREKATSNICTAQALLATMASMYAVYHGAEGLKAIASDVHAMTIRMAEELAKMGFENKNNQYFDTLKIEIPREYSIKSLQKLAEQKKINFRYIDIKHVGISLDETTNADDINAILKLFSKLSGNNFHKLDENYELKTIIDPKFSRTSEYLTLDVFNKYRSETEMMRYIKKLERKDISLTHSMIPLGSCTMKLNAAVEMLPISWPEFNSLHPFAPVKQAKGYHRMFEALKKQLANITGLADVSLQPNSGAAGEYTGLMVIRAYLQSIGQEHRNIVLIPASAHGTNPASAVMAGMDVVVVDCNASGDICMDDLRQKAEASKDNLAAFMVTYPSTHGVFETEIKEMCDIIHQNGGQVYMDGANMNAQIGYTNPGLIGADVCHLNLHKTFAIPHGGGGPGIGPIAVAEHLVGFLPKHEIIDNERQGIGAVSAAPWGSASVLPITYGYINMLGADGLKKATEMAIVNANYLSARLSKYYDILYKGQNGYVAHEMILECRNFKTDVGITETDIAKRLMDYGFHAPTLSFPVAGTLMVEPTESESLEELDRFVEAMVNIYHEIMEVKQQKADKTNNVLVNAPHTEAQVIANEWTMPYSRQKAAYPLPWVQENKFWPSVLRVDNAYGDRNLMCTCAPIDEYRKQMNYAQMDV